MSEVGRYFTPFLTVFSFGIFAYAISTIIIYLADGEFEMHLLELRKVKKIRNLQNHIIICGYGRNGKQIVQELNSSGQDYGLIEKEPEVINEAIVDNCNSYLKGEATDDNTLIEAGIAKAKALITTLPVDADNVCVVLTAREMNRNLLIVSRSSKYSLGKRLNMADANRVVMHDRVVGTHMALLVIKLDVA